MRNVADWIVCPVYVHLKGEIIMTESVTSELEAAVSNFIKALGEDLERDGIADTPKRFVKQLQECLAGYEDDPEKHVKTFDNDNYRDLIIVRDTSFSSLCEHHVLPFFGTVDVAYLPNDKILGLSKFARITDAVSKRLQVQERMTKQLADILESHLQAKLLIVRISAKHMCMSARGVRRTESFTETLTIRGDAQKYAHYVDQFYRTLQEKER